MENRDVPKPCSVYPFVHAFAYTIYKHAKYFFKVTKDIEAGQELFFRYGSAKRLACADVEYASTMWRPDLHPLPYRRKVAQRIGAYGRHSYAVLEDIRPGSILEFSVCVKVSVFVVDQLPFLWDFVLTGEMEYEHTGCPPIAFLFTYTHRLYFADQGEVNVGERAGQVLYFISPLSLSPNAPTHTHPKLLS